MNGVDVENGIRLSWQLVSQFVSWEFCRYMCEQKNETTEDMDVLVLLRNMIVQRTEKTISEVTKQEIIAKFLMELKVLDECRYPFIKTLSDTVVKICPEMEAAVHKLMHHLASFLSVIDRDGACLNKELVKERIELTIAEFSKEAETLLPQPELLQMVNSWKVNRPTEPLASQRKIIFNRFLYEKVLELIHFEQITPSESKLIALALREDEVFQKILRSSDAEPDSEPDSDIFSSQSSQAVEPKFSQEFEKKAQQKVFDIASVPNNNNADAIPLNTLPDSCDVPDISTVHEFIADPKNIISAAAGPKNYDKDVIPFDTFLGAYDVPSTFTIRDSVKDPVLQDEQSSKKISDTYPVMAADPLPSSHTHPLQTEALTLNVEDDHEAVNEAGLQFAQSSAQESDSDCYVQEQVNQRLSRFLSSKNNVQEDDSPENSDCDANPDFRFLTPTYFRKDLSPGAAAKSKVIWISDTESFDSSINTVSNSQNGTLGSQKTDPNWTRNFSLQKAFYPPNIQKKTAKKRSKAKVLSDSEESNKNNGCDYNQNHINSESHDNILSPPAKRRQLKKMVKLYKSPSTSYADFHLVRRPVRISVDSKFPSPEGAVSPFTSSSSSSSSNSDSPPNFYLRPKKQTPAGKNSKKTLQKPPLRKKPAAPPVQSIAIAKPAEKKKPAAANSTKRQKCQHCKSSYKTKIALKRHIFLKHFKHNTPDDIEDDSDLS